MMSIIQESVTLSDVNITKKDSDIIEFIAVLQEADAPNRNGRIYPKAVLEKALNSPYIKERLETKTFYCEAGHPSDPSVQRQMTIDHHNIACIITEFWWEGNLLKGRVETAKTAVGRDMKGLIEQGSKVAFSLRAQGNVHTDPSTGLVMVDEGLSICCYDWVITPSHAKAFMEKICEETINAMYKTTKNNLNSMVLTESENLFMNGNIINITEGEGFTNIDYSKNYNTNFKKIYEMYQPTEGDKVVSITESVTIIKNDENKTMKTVVTEDYIVKDIRNKIMELNEGKKDLLDPNFETKTVRKASVPNWHRRLGTGMGVDIGSGAGASVGSVAGPIGLLAGTIIGSLIGGLIGRKVGRNKDIVNRLDYKKLSRFVSSDAKCQNLAGRIKNEIDSPFPDLKEIKSLKKQFSKEVARVREEMKKNEKSNDKFNLSESFSNALQQEIISE